MFKTIVALGVTATLAAAASSGAATAESAKGPYVVRSGSSASGSTGAEGHTLKDPRTAFGDVGWHSNSGIIRTCSSATPRARFELGKSATGFRIGRLTNLRLEGCVGPALLALTYRLQSPANISAYGPARPSTSVLVTLTIRVIDTNTDGSQCDYTMAGSMPAVLNSRRQILNVDGDAPMPSGHKRVHVTRAAGCFGLVGVGEVMRTYMRIKLDAARGPLSIRAD